MPSTEKENRPAGAHSVFERRRRESRGNIVCSRRFCGTGALRWVNAPGEPARQRERNPTNLIKGRKDFTSSVRRGFAPTGREFTGQGQRSAEPRFPQSIFPETAEFTGAAPGPRNRANRVVPF